jgi:acyl carrier protein
MKLTRYAARTKRRAIPRSSSPAVGDLEQLVEEFLVEALSLAPVESNPTARFVEDFGVDSFDLLELAVEAQDRFGVEISDAALAEVVTVGDFARCVFEAMNGRRLRDSARPWQAQQLPTSTEAKK